MATRQRKLKPQERRRAKRTEIAQQPRGELRLYVEDQCLDVARIRDVSPFGVCLLLYNLVADDAEIRLTYAEERMRVEVRGTVVWRKATKENEDHKFPRHFYWVGIFLYPQCMEANIEFYKAITGSA